MRSGLKAASCRTGTIALWTVFLVSGCNKPTPAPKVGEVYVVPRPYHDQNFLLPASMRKWGTNYTVQRVESVHSEGYTYQTPPDGELLHVFPTAEMIEALNWAHVKSLKGAPLNELKRPGVTVAFSAGTMRPRTNWVAANSGQIGKANTSSQRYYVGGVFYYKRGVSPEPSYYVLRLLAVGNDEVLVAAPRQSFRAPPSGAESVAALRQQPVPHERMPLSRFQKLAPTSNGFLPLSTEELRLSASLPPSLP